MLQTVASLTSLINDTSQGYKSKANETFIIQASLTIVTYDCQNMFIVPATELSSNRFDEITIQPSRTLPNSATLREEVPTLTHKY
jgi:hypothetical protein